MSNKLNPLKTEFEVSIQIDDTDFNLCFKPVNKKIQEKLNKGKEDTKNQYVTIDEKKSQLKEYEDLKAINDELLKTADQKDGITTKEKTAILFKNQDYIKDIKKLKEEISILEKDTTDINSAVEKYYKEMFDECVAGVDRVKLQQTIEDKGLSYSVIIIYINEAVRASQEKK